MNDVCLDLQVNVKLAWDEAAKAVLEAKEYEKQLKLAGQCSYPRELHEIVTSAKTQILNLLK